MPMNTSSGFAVNTLRKARELEDDKMSVILKQRTCRDDDWKALPDGHADATFLVGPEGGKISDETAIALGLVDGWLPESDGAKEAKKHHDKESKGPRPDKTGRRKARGGTPLAQPKEKPELLADAIGAMVAEVTAAGEEGGQNAADEVTQKLFTHDKKPDSRVLAARLEDNVSAAERDDAWEAYQLAHPEDFFGGDYSQEGNEESDEENPPEQVKFGGEENPPDAGDEGGSDETKNAGGPDDII